MMKKIKILMIVGNLKKCDGIASFVMNYYKFINHNKFSIDFFVIKDEVDKEYKELIESFNDSIYEVRYSNIFSLIKNILFFNNILKNNEYDFIHSNIIKMNYFYFKLAAKHHIKIILHSHTAINNYGRFDSFFINNINKETNYRLACSDSAGIFMFGNRKYTVINNAIDRNKFVFNQTTRDRIRKEMNIENDFVIGSVGRLSPEKNPLFCIDLIMKLHKYDKKYKLVLIGDGIQKNQIEDIINKNNASDYIILLGSKSNVNEYLNMFDLFVFPSLYEGLGISAIEAQMNGLRSILSVNVPNETCISPNTIYKELNVDSWYNYIISLSNESERVINNESSFEKYDVKYQVSTLEKIYSDNVDQLDLED